jgi:hypothetical protein
MSFETMSHRATTLHISVQHGLPEGKAKESLSESLPKRAKEIPTFGKASGDARTVVFSMTQLSESKNLYRKRIPRANIERSNLPGYVVQAPEPAFVAARKRPDQTLDQDLCLGYHKALRAV